MAGLVSGRRRRGRDGGSGPVVAYLGWQRMGNLGDDAIYDAVRSQLAGAEFLDLPRFRSEIFWSAATGLNRSLRRGPQVVGGGTVVGTRYLRRFVELGLKLTAKNGSYAIGVGVDDPVFARRTNASDKDELKRWVPILSEFDVVSVRGPRSAELLAEAGLKVAVSGDPALLLPRPDVSTEESLIGVNLGFGDDDLWGQDPARVAEETAVAVRQLASLGYRFVGILMNSADERWTQLALNGIAADIVRPADSNAAARELARCSVVLVSRLHAGILAALSGTPVVSLEYLPKCRDFARSIDDERSLLRTDEVSAAALVDRVLAADADAPAIRAKTNTAVDKLRHQLQTEYRILGQRLGLDT